jgi:hypothetical protein
MEPKDGEDDQTSVTKEMDWVSVATVCVEEKTSQKAGSTHAYISWPESKPATETYRPHKDKTYVMTGSLVCICRV